MDFKSILNSLAENLLSPIPMCFALGIFCKLIHGGIKIPKELYYTISIYLLMSIGFIGGHELAKEVVHHGVGAILKPAAVTLFLGCLTPITAYVILKYLGRFSVADSAGIAAHYGSTSAVTFAVATAFASGQYVTVAGSETPIQCVPNGFIPTLVTILECPGIAIALAIGAVFSKVKSQSDLAPSPENGDNGEQKESKLGEALYEVLTGQSIMLMAGMLVIGFIATYFVKGAATFHELKEMEENYTMYIKQAETAFYPFHEFFYSKGMIFRGALCIFLLEMGLVAGERLGDLLKVGPFLVAFGILWPLAHGFLGAYMGHLAGLNLGGCTVFAAIVSSASYIAAPPAVRLTLPEANPTLSITAALAITFPFNIAFGIPIYFQMAQFVGATP
jgi:hypothetical protein